MRMWTSILAAALGLNMFGCKRTESTDSRPAFVVANWWAEPRSNLLMTVRERQVISVCVDFQGGAGESRFEKDSAQFNSVVKFALLEWFRAIRISPQVNFMSRPCQADLSNGLLRVVLHYDEAAFQRQIAQTSSPTLGVYLVGEGGLHLNMAGILNPRRDPTGGRKTVLHELGHAFGLHHSTTRGAVMQASLPAASEHLTADDIIGIETVWQRVQRASPQINEPSTGTGPVVWAVIPSQDNEVSITLRHDSWFKISTAQSRVLNDQQKCPLHVGQVLRVKILNEGRSEAAHLKVQLSEPLAGCHLGKPGQSGFVYQPHVD